MFVHVDSSFVWGRVSANGLGVTLTLEDAAGKLKGVAIQIYNAEPTNYVKVDRAQLYYEIVFVAPDNPARIPAIITPADRVHVVTSLVLAAG